MQKIEIDLNTLATDLEQLPSLAQGLRVGLHELLSPPKSIAEIDSMILKIDAAARRTRNRANGTDRDANPTHRPFDITRMEATILKFKHVVKESDCDYV